MIDISDISVILLNWKRPENIKNKILPQLLRCPCVKEIIISHSNPDTIFETEDVSYPKIPIITNHNDIQNNEKYGVSLRFIHASQAKYPIVMVLDDDIIPHPATIINMVSVFQKNYPCIVSLSGRGIHHKITYQSDQLNNQVSQNNQIYHLPIALTQCCILSKDLSSYFVDHMNQFDPIIKTYKKPIWNGEDIVMSLMAMFLYKKPAIICQDQHIFPHEKCRSQQDQDVAIHNQPDHVSHRTRLLRYAIRNFFSGISHDFVYGFTAPRPVFDTTK